MAITKLPSRIKATMLPTCAICEVKLALEKATAGPYDSDGHQSFACVSHLSEPEKLILGWADFTARERYKYLHQGKEPQDLTYGNGQDAWLNS